MSTKNWNVLRTYFTFFVIVLGKLTKMGMQNCYEICFPLLGKFQVIFNSRKKTQNKAKGNTHLVFFIKNIESSFYRSFTNYKLLRYRCKHTLTLSNLKYINIEGKSCLVYNVNRFFPKTCLGHCHTSIMKFPANIVHWEKLQHRCLTWL